jgi:flagellar hook-length control protein FliK
METLPIASAPVPRSVERVEKERFDTNVDDATVSPSGSGGFDGMLQQAYAAATAPVSSSAGQARESQSEASPAAVEGSDSSTTDGSGIGGMAVEESASAAVDVAAAPQPARLVQSGLILPEGKPGEEKSRLVAASGLEQVPGQVHTPELEVASAENSVIGASSKAVESKDAPKQLPVNRVNGSPTKMDQFIASLDAVMVDQPKPEAATPMREATLMSLLRRQMAAAASPGSAAKMETPIAVGVSGKGNISQDAPRVAETQQQQASPATANVLSGKLTAAVTAAAANAASEETQVNGASGPVVSETAEPTDNASTMPLRMLLQRQATIATTEAGTRDVRSRTTTSADTKADTHQTPEQASESVPSDASRQTPRHQETPAITPTHSNEHSPKTDTNAGTVKGQEADANDEQSGGPARAEAVSRDQEPIKSAPAQDARTATLGRHTQVNPGPQAPIVNAEFGTARESFQTTATQRSAFNTPESLLADSKMNVVGQVIKEIGMQVNGQVSEMRMRLEPDTLGEVVLKVRMENGNMNAQIDVQQASVKAVLESSLPQLKVALAEHGIDVQRLDVSCNGESSSRESGRGEGERKKGYGHRRGDGLDAIEQYQTGRSLGYNTMEVVM